MSINRSSFTAIDTVRHLWTYLGLPEHALKSLRLEGNGKIVPSSYKIAHLAQASIALSALTAALVDSEVNKTPIRSVTVPLRHAVIEFHSNRLHTVNGEHPQEGYTPIGGLHKTADGHVAIHDVYPHHRHAALSLLNLPSTAIYSDVAQALLPHNSLDLEHRALTTNAVIYALRSPIQWSQHPYASHLPTYPITLTHQPSQVSTPTPTQPPPSSAPFALSGLRILDLTHVIAGPVATRTLAFHGADVLHVHAPGRPRLPSLDEDVHRGKRRVELNLDSKEGREKFWELVEGADVLVMGYRPGALGRKGVGWEDVVRRAEDRGKGIVVAELSAWGGGDDKAEEWGGFRGFDSMVQTAMGISVGEAEAEGKGEVAKWLPCQALDHATGYFLAAGIAAAVYRRVTESGSWRVRVSLAGTAQYLKSLGQFEGTTGFEGVSKIGGMEEVDEFLETRQGFGRQVVALKHSADIEGKTPKWENAIQPSQTGEIQWLG